MAKKILIGKSTVTSNLFGKKRVMVKGKGWILIKKVMWKDKVLVYKKFYPDGVTKPPKITRQWVEASYQITEND